MNTDRPPMSRRRKRLWIVAGLVALVAVAFTIFAIWFLQDDAPDAVSIGDAAAQVTATTDAADTIAASLDTAAVTTADTNADPTAAATSADDTATSAAASASGGIAGTWAVDTSIGEFSFEDSTGTFVGFRVEEELSGVGSATAVGRTPAVTGTLVIDGSTIIEVAIEADMTAITTNESRRDDRVQSALDTGEFPTATFVLATPIELTDAALAGESFAIEAPGDLTIHGVTRPVVFPLEAQLVGDTIVVVGSLEIEFADYGVSVPSAPVVVSAEDHGPIELQLFFTR